MHTFKPYGRCNKGGLVLRTLRWMITATRRKEKMEREERSIKEKKTRKRGKEED